VQHNYLFWSEREDMRGDLQESQSEKQ
jgi:hypothetical protein